MAERREECRRAEEMQRQRLEAGEREGVLEGGKEAEELRQRQHQRQRQWEQEEHERAQWQQPSEGFAWPKQQVNLHQQQSYTPTDHFPQHQADYPRVRQGAASAPWGNAENDYGDDW